MMTQSYHSIQAERHFFYGNLKEAEACCRRILALDMNDKGALRRLGDIALARGDAKAAQSLYSKAAERMPEFAGAWAF